MRWLVSDFGGNILYSYSFFFTLLFLSGFRDLDMKRIDKIIIYFMYLWSGDDLAIRCCRATTIVQVKVSII